jgi:hypothetical protein
MACDKFWMIADITQAETAFRGEFLDKQKAPRFMHPTRDQAEGELLRLQRKNPDSEFVLLEAVAVARPVTMLLIEPITAFLTVEHIDPDPDIPF